MENGLTLENGEAQTVSNRMWATIPKRGVCSSLWTTWLRLKQMARFLCGICTVFAFALLIAVQANAEQIKREDGVPSSGITLKASARLVQLTVTVTGQYGQVVSNGTKPVSTLGAHFKYARHVARVSSEFETASQDQFRSYPPAPTAWKRIPLGSPEMN